MAGRTSCFEERNPVFGNKFLTLVPLQSEKSYNTCFSSLAKSI
jgi:hypothetical protein